MFSRLLGAGLVAATLVSGAAAAQLPNARERARAPYDEGLAHMRNEALDKAARSFDQAIAIDPGFEMAHYMLGRVQLAQRNYASAVYSLQKSRDLFQADATSAATTKQERQSVIRERLADIEQLIVDTRAAAANPQNAARQGLLLEQVRQYEERKRQLQDLDRNDVMTVSQAVPGFVSLSLGSAYFRAGKLQEAEQAYLAAVTADAKIGEAHNNLAVLYMQTGRLDEAEKAVKAAEKTGLRVNPALKDEIKKRKKAGA
ncbi:MAG: tetratricopeptide repeat protein [Vicinamibacterales bacterium]